MTYNPLVQKPAPAPETLRLAVVNTVSAGGVTLEIDGQATQKTYPRLASASLAPGDVVIIGKISGTYVVLGKLA